MRHASLPRPGDERALKRLAGRVFSQALDPDKPLWELWVVEGLDEGRFALIAKLDSALVEGDGRGDLLAALFAPATTLGATRSARDTGGCRRGAVRGGGRRAPGRRASSRAPCAARAARWRAARSRRTAGSTGFPWTPRT